MSDISVFGGPGLSKTILGYLDSAVIPAEVMRKHDSFEMLAYDLVPTPVRPEQLSSLNAIVTRLAFVWSPVRSFRHPGDQHEDRGRHIAFVLEVDDISLLGKVKGFKWFAEYHGKIVREQHPGDSMRSLRR